MTKWILLVILFLPTAACVSLNANDINLRSDAHKIEQEMLSETPRGTDLETVRGFLIRKEFKVDVSKYPGFHTPLIKAYAGSYTSLYNLWFPVTVDVTIFFRFDNNHKLIDVWVTKETDAL